MRAEKVAAGMTCSCWRRGGQWTRLIKAPVENVGELRKFPGRSEGHFDYFTLDLAPRDHSTMQYDGD